MKTFYRTTMWTVCLILLFSSAYGDGDSQMQLLDSAIEKLPRGSSEAVAKELAEKLGDAGIDFLKKQALEAQKPDAVRISVKALKHLNSQASIQALYELSQTRRLGSPPMLAIQALGEMPRGEARSALERMAITSGDRDIRSISLGCLHWRGDENTVQVLKGAIRSEPVKKLIPSMEFSCKVIEYRLTLKTDEEREAWKACQRDLWEVMMNPDLSRSWVRGRINDAFRLSKERTYPFEFLRQYVEDAPQPNGVAVFLMGIQKKRQALPLLNKLSKQKDDLGRLARKTIKLIEEENEERK